MTIIHSTAIRDANAQNVKTAADVGSSNANAQLLLKTAGGVTLATHDMSLPAFGAISVGVMASGAIALATAAAAGDAAKFEIRDRDSAYVYEGTVGLFGSGADLELQESETSLTTEIGGTVVISSLVYTAGA